MKVDIVMPTYNSNRWYFRLVLRRLREEFNVNNFIVVDKFSRDGTTKVVKEYFPGAIIIRSHANLAYARYLGIRLVETEWFLFNDDDAIVLPGTSSVVEKLVKISKIGAIELGTFGLKPTNCIVINVEAIKKPTLMLKRKLVDLTPKDVVKSGLMHLARGFLFSTLIRLEAIKDWRPHPRLGAFEDYVITQHVLSKGFKWMLVDEPLVLHTGWYAKSNFSSIKVQAVKALWHGSSVRYIGIPRKLLFLQCISRIFGSLKDLVKGKGMDSINYLTWNFIFLISMFQQKYVEISR
jgi:glycosyltransferase involved in cell wall biosynthesis